MPRPTSNGIQQVDSTGHNSPGFFMKKTSWAQSVVEEINDLLYILSPEGRFLYVSPSSKLLIGYEQQQLIGKMITDFVHPDDTTLLVREFNESITTRNALRFFHRFRTAEDRYVIFESHGHPHMESTQGEDNTVHCHGFFMMARPYPTRSSQLLDSFLEHKIENVRLRARISTLRREEAEIDEEAGTRQKAPLQGHESIYPASLISNGDSSSHSSRSPLYGAAISKMILTHEALDEATAFAKPDSIADKMARFEPSYIDSVETLTGLNYHSGERSRGISTGGVSPTLTYSTAAFDTQTINGDHTSGETSSTHEERKKLETTISGEYLCTECGILDSPEWRKGPRGPKTLCNACGLRWAKKEKKRARIPSSTDSTDP